MSLSVENFLARLDEIRLIDAETVRAVAAEIEGGSGDADARALGQELVNRDYLTAFQVSALLSGRGKALIIGDYIVLDRLGRGGMGDVYRAQHRIMKRVVALKMLLKSAAENPRLVARFYREAQAAAKLAHPNIVTAHDAGEADGQIYLITEYVDGTDLSKLIKHHGRLPVEAAVNITLQAAEGLAYAHGQGVIHRDIKPGNLLVSRAGVVKILDMGLARLIAEGDESDREQSLTLTGRLMGTVEYMAPEHVANPKHADHRADIYSLGCTMYRLLTGKLPFCGETAMEIAFAQKDKPTPFLADEIPGLPIGLQQVFAEMLAKDPKDRYQSAELLVRDLKTVVPQAVGHVVRLEDFEREVYEADPEAETTPEGAALAAEEEAEARADALRVDRPAGGGGGTIPVARARRSRAERESAKERRLRRIKQQSQPDRNSSFLIWGTVAAIVGVGVVVAILVNVVGVAQAPPKPPPLAPPEPPTVEVISVTEIAADRITPADGWVDLLPAIDTTLDAKVDDSYERAFHADRWRKEADRLVLATGSDAEPICASIEIDGGYEWRFQVTVTEYSGEIELLLPVGDRLTRLHLGNRHHKKPETWITFSPVSGLNGSDRNPTFKKAGAIVTATPHRVVVRMTQDNKEAHVRATVDDLVVVDWKGSAELFSPNDPFYAMADERRAPTITVAGGLATFSDIHLRMLDGEAKLLRGPGSLASSSRLGNHALEFDGEKSYVSIPLDGMQQDGPLTIEGWIHLGEVVANDQFPIERGIWAWSQLPALNLEQQSRPKATRWNCAHRIGKDGHTSFSSFIPVESGPHHVAVVSGGDGTAAQFFIDGTAHGIAGGSFPVLGPLKPELLIGKHRRGGTHFLGQMDEMRISSVARYDKEFTPQERFEPDEHTLALYHFDEGQGDVLIDSSGHGHHGKIHGAKWVQLGGPGREAITPADGEVELLPLIHPKQDAVAGEWAVRGGRLAITRGAGPARLDLPLRPEGTYRVQFTFRRTSHANCLILTLPVGSRAVRLEIDGVPEQGGYSGFTRIGGRPARDAENPSQQTGLRLEAGREHRVEVRVSTSGDSAALDARLDGLPLVKWSGRLTALSVPPSAGAGAGQFLGVGAWQTAYEFSAIKLQMFTGEAKLQHELLPPSSPRESGGYALEFDGKSSYVEIPTLTYRGDPVTIEARVSVTAPQRAPLVKLFGERQASLFQGAGKIGFEASSGQQRFFATSKDTSVGRTFHVAGQFDGKASRLFVDGREVGDPVLRALVKDENYEGAYLGYEGASYRGPGFYFRGAIDEVRISNVARYDRDFTPSPRFEPDEHTLALYHFDEGEGDVLIDSSGNGHHGKIHGAKWVAADGRLGETITPADGEVDLTTYIDPSKDAEFGSWRFGVSGKLAVLSQSKKPNVVKNRINIPVSPSGAYELRVTFRDCDFYHHLAAVRLPIFGRSTWLRIGRDVDPLVFAPGAAANRENGPRFRIPMINLRLNLVAEVKRSGEEIRITTSVNGKPWLDWKGPLDAFTVVEPGSKEDLIGLGGDAHLLFDKVTLRVLEGGAVLSRGPVADRPAAIQSPPDYAAAATASWQPIALEELTTRGRKSLTWKKDYLHIVDTAVRLPGDDVRNAMVRAELRTHWAGTVALNVRQYQVYFNVDGNGLGLQTRVNGKWRVLKRRGLPVVPFDWFELALATIEDRVLVFIDGREVMDIRDRTHASGPVELFTSRGFDVRRLEVMRLDRGGVADPAPRKPQAMTEQEAREALQARFAERLELAGNTEEKDDDIALAASMLETAAGEAVGPAMRSALCEKTFELVGQEPQGFATAVAAMDLIANADPEQADFYRNKAISLYADRFGEVYEGERPAAALELMRLLQRYARLAEEAGDLEGARSRVLQAARAAEVVDSPHALLFEREARRLDARGRALAAASDLAAELEQAPADQSLHRQAMDLHLLSLDDPAAALEHVDLAGESESRRFLELAAGPAGELGELDLIVLGQWYGSMARDARGGERATALRRADTYYTWYLARHRDDDAERATAQAERAEVQAAIEQLRTAEADEPVADHWTDLLQFADPSTQAEGEERWHRDESGLSGSGKIFLPLHPEGSYRIRLRFNPPQDTGWELRIPLGDQAVPLYIRPDQVVAVGHPLSLEGDPMLSPARAEDLELTVLRHGRRILVAVDLNGDPYMYGQVGPGTGEQDARRSPASPGFMIIGRDISVVRARLRMVDGWMRLLAADGR